MSRTRNETERRLDEAAEAVRRKAGRAPRPMVIVTGSGLSGLASVVSVETRIEFADIPHVARPSVVGHSSSLYVGDIRGVGTMLFAGRVHLYEGRTVEEVVFAVRLARRLGGQAALVTNAAGGVGCHLDPGDLMLITDHVDLTFQCPSMSAEGGDRSAREGRRGPYYSPTLRQGLREAARREKIDLKEGVYAGTVGPSYETRAESDLLSRLGADAVGMSTVLEVCAACRSGMEVAGISCIANRVPTWGRSQVVTHDEVVECMRGAQGRLERLIPAWMEGISFSANG